MIISIVTPSLQRFVMEAGPLSFPFNVPDSGLCLRAIARSEILIFKFGLVKNSIISSVHFPSFKNQLCMVDTVKH